MNHPPAPATAPAPAKPDHFGQLDALRGVAVIFVLIHHLVPNSNDYLAWGPLGVRIFFVMSGFLITRTILDRLARSDNRLEIWKRFYQGRALRILPIYLLTIGIAAALDIEPARKAFGWLMAFSINIYMGLAEEWAGCLSHLWFLAAGEQFYLFWTAALLLAPRALVPYLIGGLILLAPAVRAYAGAWWGWSDIMVWFSALTSMDTIMFGAWLSLLHRGHRDAAAAFVKQSWTGIAAGILLAVAVVIRSKCHGTAAIYWVEPIEAIGFSWLVFRAILGFEWVSDTNPVYRFLSYTGTVSYGLYIIHPLVHGWVIAGCAKAGLPSSPSHLGVMGASVALSYLIATAAFRWVEQPCAALKSGRPQQKPAPQG